MKFEKFHFVDYLSLGLLLSLLFFTVFSSSYLNSKKTINTKAYECNCREVEDTSNCITEEYSTGQDCTTDDEGNETCSDYQYVSGCSQYGTKQECDDCADVEPTDVPDYVEPTVEPTDVPDYVEPTDVPDYVEPTNVPDSSDTSNCTEYGGVCSISCADGYASLNGGTCLGSNTCCYKVNALVDSQLNQLSATDNCGGYNGTCMSGGCASDYVALNGGTCSSSSDTCCMLKSTVKNLVDSNTAAGTSPTSANNAISSALSNLTTSLVKALASSLTNSTTSPTTYMTSTPYPTSTPRLTSTPIPTSTPTPAGVAVNLNMRLRFQGLYKKATSSSNTVDVKVILYKASATTTAKKSMSSTGTFTSDDSGIWTGTVAFASAYPGDGYYLLVKPARHGQKRICSAAPTNESTLDSGCTGTFAISAGDNTIDMTGVNLLAGDVNQDGSINGADLLAIRLKLGKTDYSSLAIADLNYDGVVNSQDYSMAVQAWYINETDQD